jgi:hypothetical protein
MATSPITSSTNSALFARQGSSGAGSSTFLGATDKSGVQKILESKQSDASRADQNNFFFSENYLRMKAFEIRARIVMYQSLGLTDQYQQAQQEGQIVVQQYQAYQKAQAANKDPIAAVKAISQKIQFEALIGNRTLHLNTTV